MTSQADTICGRQPDDARISAAGRLTDPARVGDLLLQCAIARVELPGDDVTAPAGERQAKLGEFPDGAHCACGDEVPPLAMIGLPADGFRPFGDRHNLRWLLRFTPGEGFNDMVGDNLEKTSLLADRIDDCRPCRGHGYRQWDARKTGATADVDQAWGRCSASPAGGKFAERDDRDETVQNMVARDLFRRSQGGQVDDRVPGQQEPDVTVDRQTTRGGKGHFCVVQSGIDDLPEGLPKRIEVGNRLGQRRISRLTRQRKTPWEKGPIRGASMPERL